MELKDIKGIGPKTIEALHDNNIFSVTDLLLTFPKKYITYVQATSITTEKAIYPLRMVKIAKINTLSTKVKQIIFTAKFLGNSYTFIVYGKNYILKNIKNNIFVYASFNKDKKYFLVDKIFLDLPNRIKVEYQIKGIQDKNISKIIYNLISSFKAPKERLPQDIVSKYQFIDFGTYLLKSHFPNSLEDLRQVERRRIYERFYFRTLFNNLFILKNIKNKEIKLYDEEKLNNFISSLEFKLTSDQEDVIKKLLEETKSTKRINRLIEGDVGCGKTIVALIASYANILAGKQVAFIAPTIILATQHYNNARKYFDNVYLLTSDTKEKERKEILDKLAKENIILFGTHSLLNIDFSNLGLVIIDEQHRFGVRQRSILQKKYPTSDTLYLSATPIPRSLALAYYNSLDLSQIKTKPLNRAKITTKVYSLDEINKVFSECKNKISQGEQIFIVVPLIEGDTLFDLEDTKSLFSKNIEARYAILHGKMKNTDKVRIIEEFNNHEIDILIATTIIEVGIDVKNASIMIVMNGERFGLSTLHQLRGRVGRSDLDSSFFLITNDTDNERLKILEEVSDGFILAEEDLKMRGPGEFLGHNQSGFINDMNTELEKTIFKYASLDAKNKAEELYLKLNQEEYEKYLNYILKYEYENN